MKTYDVTIYNKTKTLVCDVVAQNYDEAIDLACNIVTEGGADLDTRIIDESYDVEVTT